MLKSKKNGWRLVVVHVSGFEGESCAAFTARSSKQVIIVYPFACFNNILATQTYLQHKPLCSPTPVPHKPRQIPQTDSLRPLCRQIRTTRQMTATTRSARDSRCQCSSLGGGAACSRAGRPPERSGQPQTQRAGHSHSAGRRAASSRPAGGWAAGGQAAGELAAVG